MERKADNARPSSVDALDAAWKGYRDGIEDLRETLHAMPIARTAADHAAADRWLIQSQAAAHNLLFAPDPRNPRFLVHSVFEPNVQTWLLPNPDFLYRYAFLDGRGTYRIEGQRDNSLFIDFQTISGFWGDSGMRLMESYDAEGLGIGEDGAIDIHLGPVAPADGRPWIRTDPEAERTTLIVREAFYDWSRERRSRLSLAPTAPDMIRSRTPDAAEMAQRLDAAGRMIRFCHDTFSGQLTSNVVDAVGYNRFLLLDTSRDEDAANPVAGYVPVVFDLAADEALVFDFEVPRAAYWGLQVGDLWWQAADYMDHQSSLNGHQIEIDPDGRVRVVLAAEDPGVPNWLDTTGISRGVALLRWYHADRQPVPEAKRLRADEATTALHDSTPRINPEERRRRLEERRKAILRRYFD